MSLVALAVDAMLPALPAIAEELGLRDPNDAQYVIAALFLGLAIGQLFFGPLSDRIGRRPAIFVGLWLFMVGCVVSFFASSFEMMIIGRMLQGIGASGPRIVTMAIVRDRYSGRPMARILSFITAVFILVPALAPLLGQMLLFVGGWRAIFGTFLMIAITVLIWFALRQPETLPQQRRRSMSPQAIVDSIRIFFRIQATIGYTIAMGLIFAPFVAYLSADQQIFQETYKTGHYFPVYFGLLALAIGAGSVINDRILAHYGMHQIVVFATRLTTFVSTIAFFALFAFDGLLAFWLFVTYLTVVFICMGGIFGNLNALAMEPLGHIAGIGAALVSSLATLISVSLGSIIGQAFDGTVYFQIGAFSLFGFIALTSMHWAIHKKSKSQAP